MQFDAKDPNKSIIELFTKIKQHLKPLIDFDDETAPIREKLDLEELKLGSPVVEIARDVRTRIMFLFEVEPSLNYLSEVTKIGTTDKKTFRKLHTIIEEDDD